MKNTECCNQNCNQGRTCPLRTGKAQDPQARIAQLEALLKFADERINKMREDHAAQLAAVKQGVPVAWRYQTPTGWHATTDADAAVRVNTHHPIEPLYTHPTQQGLDATVAAMALCKHIAGIQGLDFEEYWKLYSEYFKQEAQIVLDAAQAKQGGV